MEIEGPVIRIKENVFKVRGQTVVSAEAAAAFYEVSLPVLMRAVKRDPCKFTRECMFHLSRREQAEIPELQAKRKPVLVFTEVGVAMLSTVLKSSKAIATHIQIVRETVQGLNILFEQINR